MTFKILLKGYIPGCQGIQTAELTLIGNYQNEDLRDLDVQSAIEHFGFDRKENISVFTMLKNEK